MQFGKKAFGKKAIGKNAIGKNAIGKNAIGKKAVWKEGSLERMQFGKKADGRDALGKKAIVKEASGGVWEGQAFGKGLGESKGADGCMMRQERRQARAMTLARDLWQQLAPTIQQQSAANSEQ